MYLDFKVCLFDFWLQKVLSLSCQTCCFLEGWSEMSCLCTGNKTQVKRAERGRDSASLQVKVESRILDKKTSEASCRPNSDRAEVLSVGFVDIIYYLLRFSHGFSGLSCVSGCCFWV